MSSAEGLICSSRASLERELGDAPRGEDPDPCAPGRSARARSAEVSVVIPTIDRPAAISRCLEALLGGTMLPARIIVVDQSRGEATARIVSTFAERGIPISYVHQTVPGVSRARNEGIRRSSTSIVAFIDDDCVPHATWVDVIHRSLTLEHSIQAVSGRILPLGPAGPGLFQISARLGAVRSEWQGRVPPWHAGSGGNLAARRVWLERAGLFDCQLGPGTPGRAAEDVDLLYRLLRSGARIRFEPGAVVYH